ncbi:MAG: acetyltransferase [Clostridiaceae bacterium]|nr:acetyltransferase [Clostridiaceae bacterium]MBW4859675.1 acetyltransferase [Clostridiaceae bacterium]MBW4868796.1 acetyltransferase [Clostridiaceae bacterium]
MKSIVLIGGGGHSKVIIDIIRSTNEYKVLGITEKSSNSKEILGIPIIGSDDMLEDIYKKGVEYAFICVGAIGDMGLRNKLYKKAKSIGFKIPTLIHKHAVVSSYSNIGEGTCLMAGTIINPNVKIGKNSIINTGSIIEHDCVIKDNVQISPGTILAGNVKVNNDTFIGMGTKVIQGLTIGSNVTIGAGSVVIKNVESNTKVAGVPARVLGE